MTEKSLECTMKLSEAIKTRAQNLKLDCLVYASPSDLQFFSGSKSPLLATITIFLDEKSYTFECYNYTAKTFNPELNPDHEYPESSEMKIDLRKEKDIFKFFELIESLNVGYSYNDMKIDFDNKPIVYYEIGAELKILFESRKEEGDERNYLYRNIYGLYDELLPILAIKKVSTKEEADEYFKTLFHTDRKRDMANEQLRTFRDLILQYRNKLKETGEI